MHGMTAAYFNTYTTVTHNNDTISGQVCRSWIEGKTALTFIRLSISLFIVVFNILLRNTVISLIKWVGRKLFQIKCILS